MKFTKRINSKNEPVSTEEVAQYILTKYLYDNSFNTYKLRLLTFYCQIQSLSILKKPLFNDSDFIINNALMFDFRGKKLNLLEEYLFDKFDTFINFGLKNKIKCVTMPMERKLSRKQEKLIDSVLDFYGSLSVDDLDYMFSIDKRLLLKINDNQLITLSPEQVKERLEMTIQQANLKNTRKDNINND